MKMRLSRDDMRFFYPTEMDTGIEIEIPEAQADWINSVFADFHEAQTYLSKNYEIAIRGRRHV